MTKISRERAKEILQRGDEEGDYRKHMTVGETDAVYELWDKIDKETCFSEILQMLADEKIPASNKALRSR